MTVPLAVSPKTFVVRNRHGCYLRALSAYMIRLIRYAP